MKRNCLLLISLILFPLLLKGQDSYLGSTALHADLLWLPKQELKDTTATFEFTQIHAGIHIPLIKKIKQEEERPRPSIWLVNATASGSLSLPAISHFAEQRQLIGASVGGNGIYYNGKKNLYFMLLNASFAEDNITITSPQLRLTGFGMLHRKVNDRFGYNLGLAYSYVFGKGLLLPIIGFNTKLGERTRLHVTLPFNVSISYRKSKQLHWRFFLSPSGSQSNFANDGIFADTSAPVLKFRRRETRIGAGAKYITKGNFTFTGSTGIAGRRRLIFADDRDVIYKDNIGATLFIEAGIAWKIPKKNKEKAPADIKSDTTQLIPVEKPEITEENLLLEDIDLEDILQNE